MPLQAQLQNVHAEMMLVRESMQEIAKAVTRLAVLEEKHNATALKCDALEEKQNDLAKTVQLNDRNTAVYIAKSDGITTAMGWMWGAFGTGILYIGWQVVVFIVKTLPA